MNDIFWFGGSEGRCGFLGCWLCGIIDGLRFY